MSNLFFPPCPTGCDSSVVPVKFDKCAPEYHWGEISKVYIAPVDIDLSGFDASDPASWSAKLSDTDAGKIRTLIGIGEMGEPEITEVATSGDRKAYGFRQYSFSFTIDETGDENYEWMVMTGCNMAYRIWYETADGTLYGGNEGLRASAIFHEIIPRGRTEIRTFQGNFRWTSMLAPPRCESPIAE